MSQGKHVYLSFVRHKLDCASCRISTWFFVFVIVGLSLVPGNERPNTRLTGAWEHWIAYAGTGLAATLAYHRFIWSIAGLSFLSFMMEYMQNFIPGRQPAVSDALISTAGGASGAVIAMFMATTWRLFRRHLRTATARHQAGGVRARPDRRDGE
jgi:VanZ family protein